MEILHIDISGVTTVVFKEFNKYIWIRNKTSNPVYASLASNVGERVAGTTEILGRESGMILMSDAKTIYISGSGSVEIKASDFAECPFKVEGKGGEGGTSDYNDLLNKPSINGVPLVGDQTAQDLGITVTATYKNENLFIH